MAAEQHILIAANPKSGAVSRQRIVTELREALLTDGYSVTVCESLERVQQLAAELHRDGKLTGVVSAGGDGTAAALANRIAPDVPLLVFPLGTENLLAKHFGMTQDVAAARNRIRLGKTIAMDVGLANGQVFLVMASCGFDAAVVETMHRTRKGHINRWSYAWPILHSLRHYRFPMLRIEHSDSAARDATVVQSAAWLFVFNLPRYAANLKFCPQADPLDGQLDVCTFKRPGVVRGCGYLASLWLGKHQGLSGFSHMLSNELTIHSASPVRVPYQLDGDPGGVLPLTISTQPGRLKLFV